MQRFDVSENYNHNRANRNKQHSAKIKLREYVSQSLMWENLAARKYLRLQNHRNKCGPHVSILMVNFAGICPGGGGRGHSPWFWVPTGNRLPELWL